MRVHREWAVVSAPRGSSLTGRGRPHPRVALVGVGGSLPVSSDLLARSGWGVSTTDCSVHSRAPGWNEGREGLVVGGRVVLGNLEMTPETDHVPSTEMRSGGLVMNRGYVTSNVKHNIYI